MMTPGTRLMSGCAIVGLISVGMGRVAAAQPTPTPTPAYVPTPSGVFAIRGHIAAGPGWSGNLQGAIVSLSQSGPWDTTETDGRFAFLDLTYGYYYLQIGPNCRVLPCYPDQPVFLDGSGDVELDICRADCPATLLARSNGVPNGLLDVSGRCDAASGERPVEIWFDDARIGTVTSDTDGVYQATVAIPLDAAPDADHLLRAVLDGNDIATRGFTVLVGSEPCVGDCNGDGAVTVDELLRAVGIALQAATLDRCRNIDASNNGVVSIAELVTGVQRLLNGCHRPDLVPLGASFSRCVQPECTVANEFTMFMEVCVANQGNGASSPFSVRASAEIGRQFPALAAGAQECQELPFVADPLIVVDDGERIAELDESNNTLEVALSAPTGCEITAPPCTVTPTPPPLPTPTPT